MSDLYGTYLISLDKTGRIRLPKTVATAFGKSGALCYGDGIFLELYPEKEWKNLTAKFRKNDEPWDRKITLPLTHRTESRVDIQLDKKSRITIPESHREYAELKPGEDVVLTGALTHLRLWTPEQYEKFKRRRSLELLSLSYR